MKDKTIVVWFSCGVASAVATKLTVDKYGKNNNVIVVNTPIYEEHPDNIRFLNDVSNWVGYPIYKVTAQEYPNSSIVEVFNKRKYMSGVRGAPCTMKLKKEARYEFERKVDIDWHVLGFTYDELPRHQKFTTQERENLLPVLIDEKLTKNDCFEIIKKAKIDVPLIYTLGFPNANCIGCVKSSSPTYWNLVRTTFPEVFQQRAKQSRDIGCKLVKRKGERIFLDELLPTDKGGKIKSWDCGIFCDT